ncbi:MAG: HAMP domain-containing histidine kinase [Firmicutes bacterium]|nr:HAMP domain-containing histidine kinase [Bacillota bacterium]
MKKKTVLNILFHGFIVCSSIVIVSLFGYMKEQTTPLDKGNLISNQYEVLEDFAILEEMKLNPDYQPLRFTKEVNKEDQKMIENLFKHNLLSFVENLERDPSFYYLIKDNSINKEVSNPIKPSKDLLFQGSIIIGKNGDIEEKDDFSSFKLFKNMEAGRYICRALQFENVTDEDMIRVMGYVDQGEIQFILPVDMEITYSLNHNISIDSYFYDYLFSAKANSLELVFAGISLTLTFILAVLILFMTYDIEEDMIPFNIMKQMYFEFTFILLSGITTLFGLAANYISNYYIMKGLGWFWVNYIPTQLFLAGIVILWILFQYSIACCFFVIKQIFKTGLVHYCKENTIIGKSWIGIKNHIWLLIHMDLSSPVYKRAIFVCTLSLIVLFTLLILGGLGILGFILAGIFYLLFIVWVIQQIQEYQNQYIRVLDKSNKLANGDFETEHNDFGIFDEFGKSLDKIQTGFEKAVKEEVKSQNMKNELISNVSHDLKTPLTCIKNYVTLLQDESIDETTRKEYIENLVHYTNRMQSCIQDLFEISRVNSQNLELDLQKLDLVSLCEQVLFESEDIFQTKNLQVINNLKGNIFVELDGEKSVRILENLFMNISKYALPNSRVYLDMKEDEYSVSFIFKNISEEPMNFTSEEIVERFVRGDKSRHETGSGLGLAIVKSFTEVQGGNFVIEIEGDLFKTILSFPKVR